MKSIIFLPLIYFFSLVESENITQQATTVSPLEPASIAVSSPWPSQNSRQLQQQEPDKSQTGVEDLSSRTSPPSLPLSSISSSSQLPPSLSQPAASLLQPSFPVEQPTSSSEINNQIIDYEALEVVDKKPSELIRLRGFRSEVHYARTKDGYHIHIIRIINPKNVKEDEVFKRPVIFNHGLLESSTIWLINSRNIKPMSPPKTCGLINSNGKNNSIIEDSDSLYLNGPLMLSNYGFDVWLMSMRGSDWSLRHDTLSPKDPRFWDYSLDDFALIDVPTVIDYVRLKTGAPKVGYIGHSQATFSIFGLLSIRPKYAEVLEPIIAIAPVAFFDHISSIGRSLFIGTLKLTDSNKNAPFPWNARSIRKAMAKFCRSNKFDYTCQLLSYLVSGSGKKRLKGFYNHLPFYTSLKVLRHFGQLILSRRNTMYDYGPQENLRLYRQPIAPSYPFGNIISRSLCLISTNSDALSTPEDVIKFKSLLRVPLYKDIFIDKNFNHMDLILDKKAGQLVFKDVLEIFESFEQKSGSCAQSNEIKNDKNDEEQEENEFNNNVNGEDKEGQELDNDSKSISNNDKLLNKRNRNRINVGIE